MEINAVRNPEREKFGKPLEGIRVLAVEQMQAAPFGTQLMAMLGADVVKVEPPVTGESARDGMHTIVDEDGSKVAHTFLRSNLSKKSIAIDIKSKEGKELFKRLVPHFDAVIENYKPGTMDKWELGYEVLAKVHPPLVYVSVSGFGNLDPSPYQKWPAYAPIVLAMSGICEALRKPDEYPPVSIGTALADIASSLYAVIGMLSAIMHRNRTGRGQYVDIAMMDTIMAMADMVPFMWSMNVPHPAQSAVGLVAAFKARGGFFLICVLKQHQFKRLAELIGKPEWLTDERLMKRQGWVTYLDDVIRPAVEAWAKDMTHLEAANTIALAGIPVGPYLTAPDLAADEHVRMRNMLVEVPKPDGSGPFLVVGNPVKMSGAADGPVKRWPKLGEHTDTILQDALGLKPSELAALRAKGVIGGA